MNQFIFAFKLTLIFAVFSGCLNAQEKVPSEIGLTVIGFIKNPVAITMKMSEPISEVYHRVELTEFSQTRRLYRIRIQNVRPQGNTRLVAVKHEIAEIYFTEHDTFESLQFMPGDVIYIPSKW